MKFLFNIFGLLLFHSLVSTAQPGYETLKNVKRVEIPFEYTNHLIVVNLTFNQVFPLKFIFDTGAENTILSKRNIADVLGIPFERKFNILGSDMQTILTAYLIRGVHLRIDDMIAPNHSMLVLDQDYFNLEELLGMQVDGILGADIFRGLTVKINYERKIITLMKNSSNASITAGFQALPLLVEKNKPYLQTVIKTSSDTSINVKLLLDTGAMLSLLLNTDSHPNLKPPPNTISGNIGAGLGGFLTGHLGRINSLKLGELQCTDVVTNFQTLEAGMDTTMMLGRNGVIGNEILSRFLVIIDYPGQQLYLKPNKRYKEKFEFDKSGLVVIAADYRLNQYLVHSVIAGSPAEVAGIKAGDKILRINCSPASLLSLERIQRLFQKETGKKTTVLVRRDGSKRKFVFQLRDLI